MDKRFTEPKGLNHTGRFHNTFDLPILGKPKVPSSDRCQLRVNLLQEELNELKEAIEDQDIVEIADALCDLQYVLSGAIHEFGLSELFSELFDEVQRSNMSKTCKSMEEAEKTSRYYESEKQTSSVIVQKEGEFLVYRQEDRKVLKSVNYSPADLKSILCKNS